MKINQQLEQITIPNIKNIEIFWALFPALEPPKDKKAARELIREASSSGGLLSQAGRVYRPWKKWV